MKIAFYIMNSKGYYSLKRFINEFSSANIAYIVGSEDSNIHKDYFDEIKTLSEEKSIPFFERKDSYVEQELTFVGYRFAIGWRWIIQNENNLIVFHDSILPRYRGFAPLVNSLINSEKKLGVTALFASSEYDNGNIIAQKSIQIEYPIKIKNVIQKIEPVYFDLLKNIYLQIKKGLCLNSSAQDEADATYSMWLDNQDYFIDWTWSADKVKRFIDAVGYPYNNAKAIINGASIKVIDAIVLKDVKIENRERHIGKVIFMKNNIPTVVCAEGLIFLTKITDLEDKEIQINFRSRFQ